MPLTYDDFKKLANGSDIRGVAIPGVPDEPVTLTPEAANRIAAGFVRFLSETTGKSPAELQIAASSRDSPTRAHTASTASSPPPPPCSWRPSSRTRRQTARS